MISRLWIRKCLGLSPALKTVSIRRAKTRPAGSLHVIRLEDRTVLTTYTATDAASLQTAIASANADNAADTVILQPGTYSLSATLHITNTVSLLIQGNGQTINAGAANNRAFLIDGGGTNVTLMNLTVSGGTARDDGTGSANANAEGGAILDNGGTLTLDGVQIEGNAALAPAGKNAEGGGVYIMGGTLSITDDSVIRNNRALGGNGSSSFNLGGDGEGGGVYDSAGFSATNKAISITGSSVTGNSALGGDGADGTAGSVFGGNGGDALGGGLFIQGGAIQLAVSGDAVSGNDAVGGSGGAGYRGADATAADTNGSSGNGGGNAGKGLGGGLYLPVASGSLQFVTTTISNNAASGGNGGAGGVAGAGMGTGTGGRGGDAGNGGVAQGGGVFASSGNGPLSLGIASSTVSGNSVNGGGGGANGAGGAGGASGAGGQGSSSGFGGDASGGGIYAVNGIALTIGTANFDSNVARGGTSGAGSAGGAAGSMGTAGGSGGNGTSGGFAKGGALYFVNGSSHPSTAAVSNAAFAGNSAVGGNGGTSGAGGSGTTGGTGGNGGGGGFAEGGGVFTSAGNSSSLNATFSAATISGNSALGGTGNAGGTGGTGSTGGNAGGGGGGGTGTGGGVYTSSSGTGGLFTFLNSTIALNSVASGRGGAGGTGGQGTVGTAGNGGGGGGSGPATGGGVSTSGGTTLTLTNVTVAYNSSASGSVGQGGSAGTGNSAGTAGTAGTAGSAIGGGVDINSNFNGTSTADLSNALIVRNNATTGIDINGAVTSGSHDLVGDADGSTGLEASDGDLFGTTAAPLNPGLSATLANNGGSTQTLALLTASPAIDAGNNAAASGTTDQRGDGRTVNGTVDIGAVESQSTATTTALTASPNPVDQGATVTLTATVSPTAAGAGAPTGSVTFSDGMTVLGMVPLSGGVAVFTSSTLGLGPNSITASYPGSTTDGDTVGSSASPAVSVTVQATATTTALTATPNPATQGSTVSLIATVSPTASGVGPLSGSVTFTDGMTVLGTVPLSGGVAVLSSSTLGLGSNIITATYSGSVSDGVTFGSSESPTISVTVQAIAVVLTADESYVRALFEANLGRPGSMSELDFYVGLLHTSNGSQAVIASGIVHSPEAEDRLVKGWYVTYLGRSAYGGEELSYVDQLVAGQTEERVLSEILGSPEFFAHAQVYSPTGTPPQRFVQSLYGLLLSRTGSDGDVAVMAASLSNTDQTTIALGFLQSTEYRTDSIREYFNTLLGRPVDPNSLATAVSSGEDLASVRIAVESSAEFYDKAGD